MKKYKQHKSQWWIGASDIWGRDGVNYIRGSLSMGARKGNEFSGIQVLGGVLYRMCGPA